MKLKKAFNSLIKRTTNINVDGWLTINVNDPNATVLINGVDVRSREGDTDGAADVQTDSEEPLWYIVDRHSNSRRKNNEGNVLVFSDYNAASTRAAEMSETSRWWVPMRISEYNDVFGRFMKED